MSTGHTQVICCAFCGAEDVVSDAGLEAMTAHVLRCPRHPLAAVARHNALLLECLREVLAWLYPPPGRRSSEEMLKKTIEAVLARVEGG